MSGAEGYNGIRIDRDALKARILNLLEANSLIVAATSSGEAVGARTVDYVNVGFEIGFFTWDRTEKISDINKNKNVALCLNQLQVKGTARITSIDENRCFLERYRAKLPELYKKFTGIEGTCFIIVNPFSFTLMAHESDSLFLDHLNLFYNYAFRTELSPWK